MRGTIAFCPPAARPETSRTFTTHPIPPNTSGAVWLHVPSARGAEVDEKNRAAGARGGSAVSNPMQLHGLIDRRERADPDGLARVATRMDASATAGAR